MLRKLALVIFACSVVFALPRPQGKVGQVSLPEHDAPTRLDKWDEFRVGMCRFERHCHPRFKHKDVNWYDFQTAGEGGVYDIMSQVCQKAPLKMSWTGENTFTKEFGNGPRYAKSSFRIEWIPNCVTKVTEMEPMLPLGVNHMDINCSHLLRDNYNQCDNGGAGGWTDVGCLRYTFQPK